MAGIDIGDVGGNVEFSALGDIVGGDKIVHINTTIQVTSDAVLTRPLIAASPYRGLDRFEERDSSLFYGRDQLVRSLLTNVSHTSILLVLGASGSGKSSLVRAGLLPALSRVVGGRFRSFVAVPDVDPFESLRGSFLGAGFSQAQTRPLVSGAPDAFPALVRTLQRPGDQWLFFIDQFEELFTHTDETRRARFLDELRALGADSSVNAKIVLAMRADFLERLSPFPEFAKLVDKHIELVTDLHQDELRLAIEQPAAQHGVVFEPGLVSEIIEDVRGQPGALPLLQYTLDLFWNEERSQSEMKERKLYARAYREIGGVRGALRKRADEIFASLGGSASTGAANTSQEVARHLFLRLVDVATTEGSADAWRPVRRRVPISRFRGPHEQEILTRLIDAKLLVSDRERPSGVVDAEATVEVAHEALFTSWDRLKTWITAAGRVIFVKNRLADDSARWRLAQSAAASDELWAGSRLAEALELRAQGDFDVVVGGLSETEGAFIDASTTQREERRREEMRRRRRTIFALSGGLVVALALVGVAGWQWRRARREIAATAAQSARADAQRQVTRAEFKMSNGVDQAAARSAIAAARAMRAIGSQSLEVDQMLRRAIAVLPHRLSKVDLPQGKFKSFDFSADYRVLAINSDTSETEDTCFIWEVTGSSEPKRIVYDGATKIVLSADGAYLASIGPKFHVWEVASGKELPGLTDKPSGSILNFSPDGRYLVAGPWPSQKGKAILRFFDRTREFALADATFEESDLDPGALDFSSDGRYFALFGEFGVQARATAGKGNGLVVPKAESATFTSDGRYAVFERQEHPRAWHDAGWTKTYSTLDWRSASNDRAANERATSTEQPPKTSPEPENKYDVVTEHDSSLITVRANPNHEVVATIEAEDTTEDVRLNQDDTLTVVTKRGFERWEAASPPEVPWAHLVPRAAVGMNAKHELLVASGGRNEVVFQKGNGTLNRVPVNGYARAQFFSEDGRYLAVIGSYFYVTLWDIAGETPKALWTRNERPSSERFDQLTFSSDGRFLLGYANSDYSLKDSRMLRIWNMQGEFRDVTYQSADYAALAVRPTGPATVAVAAGNQVRLLRIDSPNITEIARRELEQPPHPSQPLSLAFSPDGRFLVTWLGTEGGRLRVLDAEDRLKTMIELRTHNVPFNVAFSPESRVLAIATAKGVELFNDWEQGSKPSLELGWAREVTFSPDGRYLATSGSETHVFELEGAREVARFAQSAQETLAFSADGKYLRSDSSIHLWRSEDLAAELSTRLPKMPDKNEPQAD